jgi:nucleobase:cation symporter-1, NCS1 family
MSSETTEASAATASIEPVPSAHRTSTPPDQFWIWVGGNVAPINWVLGTIGISLGLSFVQTMVVIVLGNLLGSCLFGLFCLMGHRTGVSQMVLSRLPFGRRGAYLPSLVQLVMSMAWVGVNTWIVLDFAIAALERMGVPGGGAVPYLVAGLIMVLQVALAAKGFGAIRVFERVTMPVILVVMAIMTVLALTRVDIHLTGRVGDGRGGFAAMTQLMTAIGVGWGITWLVYASDYTRFVPSSVSAGRVFRATALGMFLPTVWLAALGAALASAGGGSDPAQLVVTAFGAMALPVLLLVLHGPVAANIVVMYSASLAALTMDLRVARWKIAVATGVVASAVLLLFLHAEDVAAAFDQWLVSLVFWLAPWAGICLVDFFVVRRGRVDVAALYEPARTSRLGSFNACGVIALALGLVAAWSFQMGTVGIMQGPFSRMLGGVDLSWLAGLVVGGGVYWLLRRRTGVDTRERGTEASMNGHSTGTIPIAACTGTAIRLEAGDRARVSNPHGGQVVDLWAFTRGDPGEHLSMEHTRTGIGRLIPRVGDVLVSNLRRPMLRVTQDTSPGVHDTLIAACDPARYELLGASPGHPNCADNLRRALAAVGQRVPLDLPSPFNVFMRVDWDATGNLDWLSSPARPGDAVEFEACEPLWLVLSACPMDLNAINGHRPRAVAVDRCPAARAAVAGGPG